ncbi:MAG TPA: methylamine utilization protein MauG, partial [Methylocystis sp.]|nr:methylamine utilization protein MauG [Methylocystis sp.]
VALAPGVYASAPALGAGVPSAPRDDLGRFDISGDPRDRFAFVTPMLRGVKDSWPYMHDGSLLTLDDVVEFYDRGGGANPALDEKIKPLGLTSDEKAALAAFLKAL